MQLDCRKSHSSACHRRTDSSTEVETVKEVVVQSVSVSVPLPVPDVVPSASEVSESEAHHHAPSLPTPEISHIKSDICSVSHSFSTATTATAASVLEDDAVSKPRRHPPPPPPSFSSRRNMSERISRSPGGLNSPQGKLRPRLVRERPYNQPNPTHNRRNVDSSPLPRSGLLESPRRRSRSPATRGPSSARRSPMKRREAALEKEGTEVKVKKEEEKVAVEVKKEEDVAVRDPEVSIECFMFL
ncbi:hypothetical protein N665_4408s0004 [Sinapis alba]|nr:hypothetical protein N665_4408s0004 [Sinapis alba]